MNLRIEKINKKQIDLFLTILREIAIWLKDNGKEMWSLEGLEHENFILNNNDANLYICYDRSEPVGAFMLKEKNEFWWPDSDKGEDLFLKKLGVRRLYAGMGISKFIIDWVKKEARMRNKKYIKIEFYADRDYLVRLYEENKFTSVKRLVMPDGICIALYEHLIDYS